MGVNFLHLFRTPFSQNISWWLLRTYPAMMKLGTLIPYLKKIKKYMNHGTHPLSPANISIFSPEIGKSCYIKKYRYRIHFDT